MIKKILVIFIVIHLVDPAYCRLIPYNVHGSINIKKTLLESLIAPLIELVSSTAGNIFEFAIEKSVVCIAVKKTPSLISKLLFSMYQVIKQGLGYSVGELTSIIIQRYALKIHDDTVPMLRKIMLHGMKGTIKGGSNKILDSLSTHTIMNAALGEVLADLTKRKMTHRIVKTPITDTNMLQNVCISGLTSGLLKKYTTMSFVNVFGIKNQNKETLPYHSAAVLGDVAKQFAKSILTPKKIY